MSAINKDLLTNYCIITNYRPYKYFLIQSSITPPFKFGHLQINKLIFQICIPVHQCREDFKVNLLPPVSEAPAHISVQSEKHVLQPTPFTKDERVMFSSLERY